VLHAFQDDAYLTEKAKRDRNALCFALPADVANASTAPTFDPDMKAELEDS